MCVADNPEHPHEFEFHMDVAGESVALTGDEVFAYGDKGIRARVVPAPGGVSK